MEKFKEYIENKKVLDVGCVGQAKNSKFVKHQQILDLSPEYLLGIDNNHSGIREGKKLKYNLMWFDITDPISINKHFDTIFLLDVIEHIDNCGIALGNIYKLLKKDGYVIVTTPNVFFSKWYTQSHIKNKVNINPDHVHWFCKQTLESLFKRHNFKLVKYLHSNGLVGLFTK